MLPCPRGSRKRAIRHLLGQGVLDHVFALAGQGRPRASPHELALFEQAEIWMLLADQLVDGAAPEGTTDHRGCLQRRLLGSREQVDAGGQNGLD